MLIVLSTVLRNMMSHHVSVFPVWVKCSTFGYIHHNVYFDNFLYPFTVKLCVLICILNVLIWLLAKLVPFWKLLMLCSLVTQADCRWSGMLQSVSSILSLTASLMCGVMVWPYGRHCLMEQNLIRWVCLYMCVCLYVRVSVHACVLRNTYCPFIPRYLVP